MSGALDWAAPVNRWLPIVGEPSMNEQAILNRINKLLVKQGQHCRRSESERARAALGRAFIVDLETNEVLDRNVDLEALARELQILAPGQRISP